MKVHCERIVSGELVKQNIKLFFNLSPFSESYKKF